MGKSQVSWFDRQIGHHSKTPWLTINAQIYVDIRDNPKSLFYQYSSRLGRFFLNKFKENFKPEEAPPEEVLSEEEIKSFEIEVNKKLKEEGKEYLKCHKPDSIILLAFKKINVNRVISTDEAFREGVQFLGIDATSIPSLNSKISRELRKIFDYVRN